MEASDTNPSAAPAASPEVGTDVAPADVPTLHDEALPAPPADELLAQAVVQRVLAWHNRSRLARTLRAAEVGSVGRVALPFADGRKGPAPAFRERFAPPLCLRTLRRFAARHAVEQRPGPADWPQRDVPPHAAAGADTSTRYLISAAISSGDRRLRLLLSPEEGGPIIGPRVWRRPSRTVVALASAGLALLVAGGGGLAWWLRPTAPTPVVAAVAPPQAGASAPASQVAASAPTPQAAASAPLTQAAASATALHGALPASAPHPAEAATAPPERERAAAAADPKVPPPASPAAATEPAKASRADNPSDLYALVSRGAPSRATAEHDMAALRDLIALQPHATASRLELMPLQGRWLVVWWPFVTREQAEKARARWQAVDHGAAARNWQVLAF